MAKEKSNAKGQNGKGRTRNFATTVYPESAEENWQEILADQLVPAFISPIHNQDIDPFGETKKEHYHVILMFDSVKEPEQAKEVFDLIGGVGCEKINSIRGYARYLCHLDNPDKFQYNPDDVRQLCGADYINICSLITDKYKSISEMIEFCKINNIISYSDLLEYCQTERFDWFRVLCDNGTIVIKEYLRSRAWTKEQREKKK